MREPLISQVTRVLNQERVAFAVIGAAALAAHGYPRATADLDLLTTDQRALKLDWSSSVSSAKTEVRTGDAEDPLRGVISFEEDLHDRVELIVGRWIWQQEAIERARPDIVRGIPLPVVSLIDLVILKIDAGGLLDRRDVDALIEIHGETLLDEVPSHLPDVRSVRRGWEAYVDSRG